MARWIRFALLAIAATLFAPLVTTTDSAAMFTYDAPSIARVQAHVFASAWAGPAQLTGARERSTLPSVQPKGLSTTSSRSVVATEAEAGVLDGAVCSFDPDTQVLMADGTTKAIKDVAIGDFVEAAEPSTGQDQGGRSVTALHRHKDDDLIDITVTGRDGQLHIIHTTARHPFWEDISKRWIAAGALVAGEELRTVDGRDVVISDVRARAGQSEMLNLTVAGLHTFYVRVGAEAILVHNTCGNPLDGTTYSQKVLDQASSGDFHSFPESVDGFAEPGHVTTEIAGDGLPYTHVRIPGGYNAFEGDFHYIFGEDRIITHRLFEPR